MNNKNDWLIFVIIIFIQLGGLFLLSRLIGKKTNDLVTAKHQLLAFEQKSSSLVQLQETYQTIGNEINLIDQALPNKEKMVDFISSLEREASSSGIQTKISFANEQVVSEDNLKSVSFTLSLKGSFYKLVDYLERIEGLPQVILVDKVSIQSPAGIEGENNANLVLKIYLDPKF